MQKHLSAILFSLLFAASALAQITFEASVDKNTVAVGNSLELRVRIAGGNLSASRPALPPLPGFQVYASGQQQSTTIINGEVNTEAVYTYTLVPQTPGDHTLPALTLEAGGQSYQTQPIAIKVTGAAPAAPGGAASPEADAETARQPFFLRTEVDKKTAYVGEPIKFHLRVFYQVNLEQASLGAPDTTGFSEEPTPPPRNYDQTVQGRRFLVQENTSVLYPTKPGRLKIGPAQMQAVFGNIFQRYQSSAKSDPLEIQALPLPTAGKPATFKGDVGSYKITAALDKKTAEVHEPVTLTVTVSGEGNVKALSQPDLPPLERFKVYETFSSLNVNKEKGRVTGSKVFKTILKPDISGKLEVPPISFPFFDPRAKTYRTVQSAPLSLDVKPSSRPDAESQGAAAATKEGLKVVSQDIRFIKKDAPLKPWRRPLAESPFFLALNFLPGLCFLAVWAWDKHRARVAADPTGFLFRRALNRAKRAVDRAQKTLAGGELPLYYETLQRVFLEYLGAKLKKPAQGLTWDQVADALARRAAPPELAKEAAALWEDFDRVRFAPGSLNADLALQEGQRLRRLMDALEPLLSKSPRRAPARKRVLS